MSAADYTQRYGMHRGDDGGGASISLIDTKYLEKK